jgi:hypothetical protein
VLDDDCVVSVGLQWTNRIIGKIVTLNQRELLKKIPGLGSFCVQSVKRGLNQCAWKVEMLTKYLFVKKKGMIIVKQRWPLNK